MKYIVCIVLSIFMMLTPLAQASPNGARGLGCKRITFKKFSWLFRARTQCPVAELGIEPPLLILQIAGYICGISTIIFNSVIWFSGGNVDLMTAVTMSVFGAELVALVLSEIIFYLIWGR